MYRYINKIRNISDEQIFRLLKYLVIMNNNKTKNYNNFIHD